MTMDRQLINAMTDKLKEVQAQYEATENALRESDLALLDLKHNLETFRTLRRGLEDSIRVLGEGKSHA